VDIIYLIQLAEQIVQKVTIPIDQQIPAVNVIQDALFVLEQLISNVINASKVSI